MLVPSKLNEVCYCVLLSAAPFVSLLIQLIIVIQVCFLVGGGLRSEICYLIISNYCKNVSVKFLVLGHQLKFSKDLFEGRQRNKGRDRFFYPPACSQIATTAMLAPCQSQEPRTWIWISHMGGKDSAIIRCFPRVSRELPWKQKQQHSGKDCLSYTRPTPTILKS